MVPFKTVAADDADTVHDGRPSQENRPNPPEGRWLLPGGLTQDWDPLKEGIWSMMSAFFGSFFVGWGSFFSFRYGD